jgi:hypothetical protein
MYSIRLPFTDTAVLFSLPGSDLPGWQRAGLLLLVLLLCLVPLALVVWLYRYELHLVRRITALRLLALRLLLVILLLAVVCLQPIVGHSTTIEHPGRVVIAVDRSASMDATDPQRTALEKLRLARAFNLCTDRQFDEWVSRYDAKTEQMRWVGSDEFAGDEARRRQVTEERQRPFDDVCRQVDALTRTQIARRLLAADGRGLLPALRGGREVELLGFNREAWEVPADQLEQLFQQHEGGSKAAPANALPGPFFTDLNQPLLRAGADRGRVVGVVLLSDGRHNAGPLPDPKARELGERRVPIYPIVLGARRPPPDVALTRVEAPAAALQDVDVQLTAHVKVTGLEKQKITVTVQRADAAPGTPPLGRSVIDHAGVDGSSKVPVVIRLDQPGKQTFLVTARPAEGVKEARDDNNTRPVVIQVGGDYKPRVLLVEEEARWEYHYLATALLRDPSLRVERVLFQPPLLNPNASDEFLQRLGNPKRALPAGPDALRAFDCIVLGDVDPRHLSRAERDRLEKYVKDSGKTLILLAGKRFLPLAYLGERTSGVNPEARQADPLLKLLPIEAPHVVDDRSGFRRQPTEEGKLTAFLQLAENLPESERRWAQLPPHYWAVVGRAKPAATPLLYRPDEEKAWKDLLDSVRSKWPGSATAVSAVARGRWSDLVEVVRRQQEPEIEQAVRAVEQFVQDEFKRRRQAGADADQAWRGTLDQVEAKWPALKDAHLEKAAAGHTGELTERVRQYHRDEIERFVRDERARVRRTQEREQPLLVRQNYGLGRVLYVGIDSTWRWRYKVGDTYHHRFWSQVLHWAAADKPPIRFGTGAAVYQPGQDVDLFVRLEEEALRDWPAKVEVTARVLRISALKPDARGSEEPAAIVSLTGDIKDRQLTGRVRDLPVGTYAVELAISDPGLAARILGPTANDPKGKARATFTVVPPENAEMLDLAADWDQLQRLATESHGKVLAPEDAAELLTLLARQSAVRIDHPEHKLWQWWPMLVLLLLLLTLEWVGRKLAGLP